MVIRRGLSLLGLAVAALALARTLWAEEFQGKVIGVTDGDTLRVLRDGRAENIRLNGIPEQGQPFGRRAGQFVAQLAFGRTVALRVVGHRSAARP